MDEHLIKAAMERAMQKDMEWGVDDCCLWVCNVIMEYSGRDLAMPLRGYHSRIGAYRTLKKFAGGGLCEAAVKLAVMAALKSAKWPWKGTLVGVVADKNGPALALFWRGMWVGRTERGITGLPASAGVVAWEIPPCRS